MSRIIRVAKNERGRERLAKLTVSPREREENMLPVHHIRLTDYHSNPHSILPTLLSLPFAIIGDLCGMHMQRDIQRKGDPHGNGE